MKSREYVLKAQHYRAEAARIRAYLPRVRDPHVADSLADIARRYEVLANDLTEDGERDA